MCLTSAPFSSRQGPEQNARNYRNTLAISVPHPDPQQVVRSRRLAPHSMYNQARATLVIQIKYAGHDSREVCRPEEAVRVLDLGRTRVISAGKVWN